MKGSILDEGAESVGLGKMQIVAVVAYILLGLGLVIAFVLVTLGAWSNEDNFGAVIQSMLVGGAGKTSTAAREEGEAEDPEQAKEIAKGLIAEPASGEGEG